MIRYRLIFSWKIWRSNWSNLPVVKVAVHRALKRVKATKVPLSERELCILATSVLEIQKYYGIDPFEEPLVIQVDRSSVFLTRQRYVNSNPRLCCCMIPGGKYVLTEKWRLLTAQASSWLVMFVLPTPHGIDHSFCSPVRNIQLFKVSPSMISAASTCTLLKNILSRKWQGMRYLALEWVTRLPPILYYGFQSSQQISLF